MDENVLDWRKKICIKTASSLQSNGFEVYITDDKSDCLNKIVSLIPIDATVGIGGSMSLRELGLIEVLQKRSQRLVFHTPGMSRDEALAKRREALHSDIYLASPQSVTMDGKLIFLDSNANRSSAVSFGPRKVILVAGFNKITPDEASGIRRAKEVAAPINARRLNLKTPCVQTGICSDCNSVDRICRVLEIIMKRPAPTEINVILCLEDIGY